MTFPLMEAKPFHLASDCQPELKQPKAGIMGLLEAAIAALIVALIAGALGFTEVAAGATVIAKWLFAIFLVIAILLFIALVLGIGAAVG